MINSSLRPRQMKNVSERIEEIDRANKKLIDLGYDRKDEKFRTKIVDLYTQMRDTWERIVEEILLNRVVQRFRPEIMTQRLEEACIDPARDYPLIFDGMKRCSRYSGHDPAEALPTELPKTDEIMKDIKALRDFAEIATKRRSRLRKGRKYEKGVEAILL